MRFKTGADVSSEDQYNIRIVRSRESIAHSGTLSVERCQCHHIELSALKYRETSRSDRHLWSTRLRVHATLRPLDLQSSIRAMAVDSLNRLAYTLTVNSRFFCQSSLESVR